MSDLEKLTPEVLKAIAPLESKEVKEYLQTNNINLTHKDFESLKKLFAKVAQKGKLTDQEIENAGGMSTGVKIALAFGITSAAITTASVLIGSAYKLGKEGLEAYNQLKTGDCGKSELERLNDEVKAIRKILSADNSQLNS